MASCTLGRNFCCVQASTFKTPQLLKLSGVGDKKVLDAHGVPVKPDLPGVGANFRFILTVGSAPEAGKSYCTVFTALTHPFSSGTVHIASSDPLSAPNIDYNVLDNQIDIDVLTHGIEFARRLVATDSLHGIINEIVPGPTVRSKAELEDFIRKTIGLVFHPIGTATAPRRCFRGAKGASSIPC
ncbi:hypothetical protein GGX14DRAFT_557699 [Mycena pura]|uniref:Glucose-methanol-choline oxidoreductase N-terminal domain-containing protein n=1 Tax=Mycena pura TaxID=153505 RepID=A0AAD6YLY4_9AGAR|nr:hypothetical protein GGX14DRAFT_557699 [Mycena pura]